MAVHKDALLIRVVTVASVSVASLLILMKLFAWWETHSVSLQASLIDSLLDAAASLINMIAVWHALRPADKEHRYGHGKAESLAGLGQSLFIGGSAIWLLMEVYERFQNPEIIEDTGIGLLVMGAAVVMTLLLISFQKFVIRRTGSTAISADMLHYQSDLMINLAVIVSLVSAHYFTLDWMDPIFGLLIGLYILWTAWQITRQAFNILMDSEVEDEDRDKIIKIAMSHKEVFDVESLRTRRSGLQQFFEINLVLDSRLRLDKAHKITREVEAEIREAYPNSETIILLVPSG